MNEIVYLSIHLSIYYVLAKKGRKDVVLSSIDDLKSCGHSELKTICNILEEHTLLIGSFNYVVSCPSYFVISGRLTTPQSHHPDFEQTLDQHIVNYLLEQIIRGLGSRWQPHLSRRAMVRGEAKRSLGPFQEPFSSWFVTLLFCSVFEIIFYVHVYVYIHTHLNLTSTESTEYT